MVSGFFAALWVLALGGLVISSYGWFGQERDPLPAVYLVFLGLPWNRFAHPSGFPAALLSVLAPGVNLLILHFGCWILARRG